MKDLKVGERVVFQLNNICEINPCFIAGVYLKEDNVYYDLFIECNYVDRENGKITNVRSGTFFTTIKEVNSEFVFKDE